MSAAKPQARVGVPCAVEGRELLREPAPSPCALVIFGATGDLARRKLAPALYNLALDGALPEGMAILGTGSSQLSAAELRARIRAGLESFSRRLPLDEPVWTRFSEALDYLGGNFEDPATYAALKERLGRLEGSKGTCGNHLFYLATPPDLAPVIVRNLHAAGLLASARHGAGPWARVVLEKPFGRDLESAQALDRLLARWLDESQTYRIDHYLGKETVQNILVLRFGNSIFEPLWNRRYVDHVEITAAESIGVEGRGRFYEQTGLVRDVVQNHLLQVLALCAMEPPLTFGADDVRDAKLRLLRSLQPLGDGDALRASVVRGQYRGYREEPGVAPDSRVPTYLAARLLVHNWRWQGVPFYLRAGKRLAQRLTEVRVHFQPIPLSLFPQQQGGLSPNVLTLRIQPQEGISLRFVAKVPGDHLSVGDVHMDMSYAGAFGGLLRDAYERLLLDCMRGDATLYARRDWVEEAWRFVAPLLADGDPPAVYEPGSAGPAEADELLLRDGRRWTGLLAHPGG
ncbi:MAG TPA: glucose-6-phosphate dehydrogenase [Anaeromyxobacteraceae bacterium]|jgi:glucose-6-phosphate 1-dehydrogenase|nr:glucose-6-phosphate dehydrogenase [Anaeromyxobacteraceae bacterium]